MWSCRGNVPPSQYRSLRALRAPRPDKLELARGFIPLLLLLVLPRVVTVGAEVPAAPISAEVRMEGPESARVEVGRRRVHP